MEEKPKTLDVPQKRKIGAQLKTVRVEIDADALPPDLMEAFIEHQRPYKHDPATMARAIRARQAVRDRQRREKKEAAAARKPKGVWKVSLGRHAGVLRVAKDWMTLADIRKALDVPVWSLNPVVDRLWKEGLLLKRENPLQAENLKRVRGAASCQYQYKALPAKDPDQGKAKGTQDV